MPTVMKAECENVLKFNWQMADNKVRSLVLNWTGVEQESLHNRLYGSDVMET